MQSARDENHAVALFGVSSSDGTTPTSVYVDPVTHRMYGDVVISSATVTGNKTNNNAAPGATNIGALVGIANAAAPTYTEGDQVLLSTDLTGAIRITGSISVGGTTDGATFTAGSSTGTPAMGAYHSTIDTVTDGKSALLAIDSKRNLFTAIRDAAGNARGANVTASNALTVDGSAVTQPVSGTVTANAGTNLNTSALALESGGNLATVAGAIIAQEATTSGVKGVTTFGAVTTNAPTYVTAKSDALSLDTSGLLRVSLKDTPANTNKFLVTPDSVALPANQPVNVSQMNGITVSMGTGVMGTGVQRVAIASDNDALTVKQATGTNLHVVLDANSGVDIGKLTANQSVNVAQINGVTTLIGNGGTGTGSQRVTIASDNTAFSVNNTQQGTASQNVAQWGGTTVVNGGTAGVVSVGGKDATNVAIGTNPVNNGAQGVSSENAVVTTGRMVQLVADLVGKLIVLPYANPENFTNGTTAAITDTTSTSTIAAQGASVRTYVTQITVTNSHATVGTFVKVLEGSNIIHEGYAAAAGGGYTATFPTPLRGAANTAINTQCVTTGANVIASVSGYKGA